MHVSAIVADEHDDEWIARSLAASTIPSEHTASPDAGIGPSAFAFTATSAQARPGMAASERALESAGVEFTNGDRPGFRMRRR